MTFLEKVKTTEELNRVLEIRLNLGGTLRALNSVAREAEKQGHFFKNEEAFSKTEDITHRVNDIQNLLTKSLLENARVDWESLKKNPSFPHSKPECPSELVMPSKPLNARLGSKSALRIWKEKTNHVHEENNSIRQRYTRRIGEWNSKESQYRMEVEKHNVAIDALRDSYDSQKADFIELFFLLSLSSFPFIKHCVTDFSIIFDQDTRMLGLEVLLAEREAVPAIKAVRYIKSKGEMREQSRSSKDIDKLYDTLLYQTVLAILAAVVRIDKKNVLDAILLNGSVNALDKSIGKRKRSCILSIHALTAELEDIDFSQVEPLACFKGLKGVSSSKLSELAPVPPIMYLDMNDKRFVEGEKIKQESLPTRNLATMDWQEFEYLIREVFEMEFKERGGEVKVTRASKDGGVDAIAFNPDPISGGKIVIQAKRYVNTVQVSAVRDLYGTMLNEGAMKGILVTTSNYGPDSYRFAKDKPISLLNGSNLLYLLRKHNYKAHLDLEKARQERRLQRESVLQ